MFTNKSAPRLLGAVFLIVIVTSLVSGVTLVSAIGSGGISDMLVNISNNIAMARVSILVGMLNSVGIVFLAGLLYVVLNKVDRNIALIALGLWLAEAVFYAIAQVGTLGLIPLSMDFIKAGTPINSFYQTLGNFLYNCVYTQGTMIHMWFYCVGGLLWYYLFYRSKYVPRVIPMYGLFAVLLALIGIVFQIFGYNVPMYASIPVLPFELAIGLWLLLRGTNEDAEKQTGDQTHEQRMSIK